MNVKIKNFSMEIDKKKIIKYSIIAGTILIIFSLGFWAGYATRFKRAESNSGRIEQRIDTIGQSAGRAGTEIETGINNLNNAIGHNEDARRSIGAAEELNKQYKSKLDELASITKTYQESLQLANSTINDLFDLSIRRAELDEEFIKSVIGLSESSEQGTSK